MSLGSLTTWAMKKRILFVLALFLLAVGTPQVHAALLTLSTHVSDGVSPPDANELDATLDFSVADSTLTLAVTNLTPDAGIPGAIALKIDEIYFNATDNITGLTLTDASVGNVRRWVWEFSQGGGDDGVGNPHQVNGFGKFDMYVKDETGNPATYIGSEVTATFTFDIAWTGTAPSDTDFIELSTQVDGHIISYAAAKFYDGPNVSGFGATNVPEPATIALLGLGGLALLRKRRK